MEIAVQTRGRYEDLLKVSLWAEDEGLAAMAVPDHYLAGSDHSEPAHDSLVHLGGLARETHRIELVDLVSPITFRHPAVYAKTAVTLAEMSGGRFVLGLGTGWLEDEHRLFGFDFPSQATRFQMLEEALAYVRAFSAGEEFVGQYFHLEAFSSSPRPPFRIVVGGSGEQRTPRLAGIYADEFNLFPSRDGNLASRVAICRQSATDAGRDASQVRVSYTTPVFAASNKVAYNNLIKSEAAARGRTVEQLESRLSERHIPFGWGDQLTEHLGPVRAAGVTRLYLQVGSTDVGEIETAVSPFRT